MVIQPKGDKRYPDYLCEDDRDLSEFDGLYWHPLDEDLRKNEDYALMGYPNIVRFREGNLPGVPGSTNYHVPPAKAPYRDLQRVIFECLGVDPRPAQLVEAHRLASTTWIQLSNEKTPLKQQFITAAFPLKSDNVMYE